MFTKLTTTLMAGALALSTVATPTELRAGSEARNIIAGLAVGALVGAAIASQSNKKNKDRGGRHVSRGYDDGHHAGYHDRHHRGHKNRGGYRHKRVNLPGACRVHKGHRSGYSGRCLRRYDYSYAALPAACAVRVGGRYRTIYRDGCLNRHGYY